MKRIILALSLLGMLVGVPGYSVKRITNADVATNAALAWSKMSVLTASRVACTDGSGVITQCTMPSAYLDATSSIQTQIDGKQALDADLTALAALSGTNNIYYRSAANTWTSVTIGTGLDFTGGTLSATGGGSITYAWAYVHGGNGHGSTKTKVRLYTATEANVGGIFTISHSATDGTSIRTSSLGTYIVCAGDVRTGGATQFALFGNATHAGSGTTDGPTVSAANGRRAPDFIATANTSLSSCAPFRAAANDYFWVQDDATPNTTATTAWLSVAKVSDAHESLIYVEDGSGHGATNTKIRTFGTVVENNGGSDLTYTSDATNGDKIVVNTSGNYFACYGDFDSANGPVASITIDDRIPTTNASSGSFFNGARSYDGSGTASESAISCFAGWINAGQTLRAHDQGVSNAVNASAFFFVVKTGNTTDNTEVYQNTGSGHGSSATKLRTFSTNAKLAGANASINDSAIEGDTNFINAEGIYALCANDFISGGQPKAGFVVNQSAVTTNVTSLVYAEGVRGVVTTATNNNNSSLCNVMYLPLGYRVGLGTDGGNTGNDFRSYFSVKRLY